MLRRLTVAAVVALSLLPAATAHASGDTVIKDCLAHGRLTKRYSQREYRSALANIPTDVDEYTNCRDIIRRAQLGSGSGTGNAPTPPPRTASPDAVRRSGDPLATATARERAAVARDRAAAVRDGGERRSIAGGVVTPGALAYRDLSAVSKLPTALVILSLLVVVAALAVIVHLLVSRVRAHRSRP